MITIYTKQRKEKLEVLEARGDHFLRTIRDPLTSLLRMVVLTATWTIKAVRQHWLKSYLCCEATTSRLRLTHQTLS